MTPEQEKAESEKSREQIAEEVYQLDGEDLQEHLIDARMELQTLARASECHSLTEEEARKITEEYSFLCGNPSRYVLDEKTVITLLMEHSNPSTVLEEVKKELEWCYLNLSFKDSGRARELIDQRITELSKGKV